MFIQCIAQMVLLLKEGGLVVAGEKQQKMERRKKHILNIDFCNVVDSFSLVLVVLLGYRLGLTVVVEQKKERKGRARRGREAEPHRMRSYY